MPCKLWRCMMAWWSVYDVMWSCTAQLECVCSMITILSGFLSINIYSEECCHSDSVNCRWLAEFISPFFLTVLFQFDMRITSFLYKANMYLSLVIIFMHMYVFEYMCAHCYCTGMFICSCANVIVYFGITILKFKQPLFYLIRVLKPNNSDPDHLEMTEKL